MALFNVAVNVPWFYSISQCQSKDLTRMAKTAAFKATAFKSTANSAVLWPRPRSNITAHLISQIVDEVSS